MMREQPEVRLLLRLSLRYGHGDLYWADRLTTDELALILAHERLEAAGE